MISQKTRIAASTTVLAVVLGAALVACGSNDPIGTVGGTGQAGGEVTETEAPTPTASEEPVQVVTGQVPADAAAQMAALSEPLFPLAVAGADQAVNPAYSPLSVYLALGLVANGASGQSAQQFADLLGGDTDKVNALAAGVMTEYITTGDGPTLAVANSLWLDNAFTVNPDYSVAARAVFRAEVATLNLQTEGQERINAWVEQMTNGLIEQIVEQVPPGALAYLVNALYFKGAWAEEFIPELTDNQSFTLADGTVVQVPTMLATDLYASYFKTEAGEGIVLPYKGGRFGMLMVMPAAGVDQVSWDGTQVAAWLAATEGYAGIELYLPKWESELAVDLTDSLKSLGLVAPFEGSGEDLVGIGTAGGRAGQITEVAHKAVVKVDEFGTEAAATTSAGMAMAAPPTEPVMVHFNRPFVFALVDRDTGLPLFLGQVDNPLLTP